VALFSHKRDANARSTRPVPTAVKVAAPVALLATLSTVGVGVLATQPGTDLLASNAAGSIGDANAPLPERAVVVSRSEVRQSYERAERELARAEAAAERRATERAIKQADTRLWTTTALNIWTDSSRAEKLGLLDAIERVLVTGRKADGRTEIVLDGKARWVTSGYLVADKPKPERTRSGGSSGSSGSTSSEAPESSAPSLGGTCTNGTSVSGQPNVIGVHEVVCANFPEITSYGTYRSDGEHAQGLAIDIMVSGSRGWEVAEFLRANYSELGINYIMYSQKIWSVDRSSEGWRYVEDRGSATANHYDHVHVTTY
jgi:hypothetical protein